MLIMLNLKLTLLFFNFLYIQNQDFIMESYFKEVNYVMANKRR